MLRLRCSAPAEQSDCHAQQRLPALPIADSVPSVITMQTTNNYNYGVGLAGWLGISFIVLKLCGVIDWSWWWVTAPLWGGLALVAALGGLTLLCFLVCMAVIYFATLFSGKGKGK